MLFLALEARPGGGSLSPLALSHTAGHGMELRLDIAARGRGVWVVSGQDILLLLSIGMGDKIWAATEHESVHT